MAHEPKRSERQISPLKPETPGFYFSIEHRKGSLNIVPDALSRSDVGALDIDLSFPEIHLSSSHFYCPDYQVLKTDVKKIRILYQMFNFEMIRSLNALNFAWVFVMTKIAYGSFGSQIL